MTGWKPVLLLLALLTGCASRPYAQIDRPVWDGQLGRARAAVLDEPARKNDDALREATLAVLTLSDGYPAQAEVPMQRVYEVLRTRGLNANKEAASKVLNESVRLWKGEPYEQAILYLYVGMQQAALGAWGNTRAAANSALDLLDEFDKARDVVRENPPTEHGYVVSQSDLALAHLLAAVANQQLGRDDEASDHLSRVRQQRPALAGLCDRIADRDYDTVLVVEMGLGPVREPGGSDDSEATLDYRWPSDEREIVVRDARGELGRFGRVLDVNNFADAYRWDVLARWRRFKSGAGTVMTGAGAALLLSDDDGAQIAGLGLVLAGLLTKANARADVRSLGVLPQRYYLVPLKMSDATGTIEVSIGSGRGESTLVPGLRGGTDGKARLVVRRVPGDARASASDAWAGPRYAGDQTLGDVPGADLPYILGGRCVMTPGPEALSKYQAAGWFDGWTSNDLRELYREEGIVLPGQVGPGIPPGLHLLEGGRSLISPEPGTLGFERLYYEEHAAYRPRSERVARLAEELKVKRETVP
ncbi:MAG: hypothetical protein KJZ65_09495 [Phycisphaerales bacterium]|nr:hypothetical protein [Phycisphaerales bacterium]